MEAHKSYIDIKSRNGIVTTSIIDKEVQLSISSKLDIFFNGRDILCGVDIQAQSFDA